jgi:hypothetical protein
MPVKAKCLTSYYAARILGSKNRAIARPALAFLVATSGYYLNENGRRMFPDGCFRAENMAV